MSKTNFKLKALTIALSVGVSFSTSLYAQQMPNADFATSQEAQQLSNTIGNTDSIEMDTEIRSNINPFSAQTKSLEEIEMKNREAKANVELLETQIEAEKKKFEKEMLPYQAELQRLAYQTQLYEAQQISSPEPEQPMVTDRDIENKIQRVAGSIINEQKETINSLKKQIVEKDRAENSFSLKLIAHNGTSLFAVISNSQGDHRVAKGDKVDGWSIIGIDKENKKVIARKGGRTQAITPNSSNNFSQIKYASVSNDNDSISDSNSERMPNPDLPPPPNFR